MKIIQFGKKSWTNKTFHKIVPSLSTAFINIINKKIFILDKLLVTTGDPIPEGSKSEVIDLSDPENVCEPLPNYPLGKLSY